MKSKKDDKNVIIINPEPLIRLEQGLKDIVKELKKLNELILKKEQLAIDNVLAKHEKDWLINKKQ
jgi:hypothetical protein